MMDSVQHHLPAGGTDGTDETLMVSIERVVSGGQTGVDRAALDVALAFGIPCGGWCPKGRRAEDGRLPRRYPLKATPSEEYAQRTEWNVRDSDGTLVLSRGQPTQGTALTIELAAQYGKPCLVLDINDQPSASAVRGWAAEHTVHVLNVAGPRESKCPGIYREALAFLRAVLSADTRQRQEPTAGCW